MTETAQQPEQEQQPEVRVVAPPPAHSHKLGGSNAVRRINCPASASLEAEVPGEFGDSDYATWGSLFHACMEMLLTADPDGPAAAEELFEQLVGQDLGFGEDYTITVEHINDKVRPAWDAWQELLAEHDIVEWFIEQRVEFPMDTLGGAFGTVDILAIDSKGFLHVLDWKFGDGVPVEVEGNYQLLFYASAALYEENAEIAAFCAEIAGLWLHIVQPRHGANRVIHSWQTTEDTVEKFIDLAVAAIAAAADPPPPKPGDHCRWCTAKVICPAQTEAAVTALKADPSVLSGVELAAALQLATQLKPWIAAVWDLAHHELSAGVAVPGYKLVNKKSAGRKWKDPDEAERQLKKKKVKAADMYTERELRSPTQLEKRLPKVYSLVEHLVHSPTSGVTVVPDSDSREAVVDAFALLANALPDGNSEPQT